MWPWNKHEKLEREIDQLKESIERRDDEINYYKSLQLSATDVKELEFLREESKDYFVYRLDEELLSWVYTYRYFKDRTLQGAESDLTKARFYISVLEAQSGPDGIEAAKKVCKRLQDLCKTKAIEAKE